MKSAFKQHRCVLALSLAFVCLPITLCHGQNVIAQGDNSYGQSSVPLSATNVVSAAAGGMQTVALRSDGSVIAWGDATAANVPPNTTNVIAIAAGNNHSLALRADHTVVAWGYNDFGQISVPPTATNITAIACGNFFSVALRADGTLVQWGKTLYGLPTSADFVGIAAGGDSALAWRKNGSIAPWGLVITSQKLQVPDAVQFSLFDHIECLGRDGRTKSSWETPARTNVSMISIGSSYSLYLSTAGTITAWNLNSAHQVISFPTSATNIISISAGASHAVAIQGDGKPTLLGPPNFADSTSIAQTLPLSIRAVGGAPLQYQWLNNGVPIPNATNAVPSIPASLANNEYSVVVSNTFGSITSPPVHITVTSIGVWGRNSDNQSTFPTNISNPVAIAAGAFHGMALDTNGTISTWGKSWHTTNQVAATSVPAQATNVAAIAGYGDHSMALRTDGTIIAWGRNIAGETNVPASATNVTAIAGGWEHALALRADGTVIAWGTNEYGQLDIPVNAVNITAIAAGYYHNLALRSDGAVVGWGDANVPSCATNIISIAAGWGHSLALRRDGTLLAWGDNTYGQATVPPEATNIVSIKAGWYHNLALRADGSLIAWGKNVRGTAVVPEGVQNVSEIAVGEDFNIAVIGSGPPRIAQQLQAIQTHAGGIAVLNAQIEGALPLTCQWYHDGTLVPGGTNRSLILTNTQPGDAGRYLLVAKNPLGEMASQPTVLTVNSFPSSQSSSYRQFVLPGSPLCLAPEVTGQEPLTYQWQLNGRPLIDDVRVSGSTSPRLCIASTTGADSGSYTLVVSNSFGVVTGLVAQVAITPIVAWGDDSLGQLDVPPQCSDVVAIASRANHAFGLKADGTVVGWGDNSGMQNAIPASATNVVAIADGGNHGLALRADGTVVAWGGTVDSKLGYPVVLPIPEQATNIIAIAAGQLVNVALRADGLVIRWGQNLPFSWPFSVSWPSSFTNVVAIGSGDPDAIALRADGSIVEYGSTSSGYWPFAARLVTNAVNMNVGAGRVALLLQDGRLLTFNLTSPLPAAITATPSTAIALAAGTNHVLLLETNGQVTSWGGTSAGEADVPPTLANVVAIAAGTAHSLALHRQIVTNRHRSYNLLGGYPIILNTSLSGAGPANCQWFHDGTPVAGVTGPLLRRDSARASDSGSYTVVITDLDGQTNSESINVTVRAEPGIFPGDMTASLQSPVSLAPVIYGEQPLSYQWQFNGTNIMDDARITGSQSPILSISAVKLQDDGIYSLILSNMHGVVSAKAAQLHAVTVVSWGIGADGNPLPINVPVPVNDATAVAAGQYHSLALRVNGTVLSWGFNSSGQTNTPNSATNITAIAAGSTHSLALKNDRTIIGWGDNSYQQCNPPANATNVVAICAGQNLSAALRADGTVVAWGSNASGQTNVPSFAANVAAIAAGYSHVLALRGDGSVIAWPQSNSYGETTVPPSATNIVAISAAGYRSMALRNDGTVLVWGYQASVPDSVADVVAIATSADCSFALRRDGKVLAWGVLPYGTYPISIPFQTNVPTCVSNLAAISANGSQCLAIIDPGSPLASPAFNAGQDAAFTAGSPSGAFATFQWQFNERNLIGATNAQLKLGNLRWTNSGNYQVVVNNGFRSFTNPANSLNIPRTQLQFDLAGFNARPPHLRLTNASGVGSVVLYESSNIVNWTAIATNSSTLDPIDFDNVPAPDPERFYQAVEAP